MVEQLAVEEQIRKLPLKTKTRTPTFAHAAVPKSYKRFIVVFMSELTRPSIRQSQVWRIANKVHSSPEGFIRAVPCPNDQNNFT